MPGYAERSIAAGGATLRYREAGDGAPLIVISGEAGFRAGDVPVAVAGSRRVLAFALADLRMAGQSPPRQAAGLAQALAALRLGPVSVLASSAGCALALWLAAADPARVACLVLESPIARRADLAALDSLSPAEIFAACHAHPERKPWLAGQDAVEAARALSYAAALITGADDAALETALTKIEMPVLALYGTRDRVTPPELGRYYKEHVVNAWFLMVYDSGHDIAGDRPEAFGDAVGDFLTRGPRFAFDNRSSRINP